jgi:hypothetical protein
MIRFNVFQLLTISYTKFLIALHAKITIHLSTLLHIMKAAASNSLGINN